MKNPVGATVQVIREETESVWAYLQDETLVWHGTIPVGGARSNTHYLAAVCVSCVGHQWAIAHGLMDGWMVEYQ